MGQKAEINHGQFAGKAHRSDICSTPVPLPSYSRRLLVALNGQLFDLCMACGWFPALTLLHP